MSNADIEVVQQTVENEVNFEGETQIVVVQERIIQVVEVVSGFVPSDEYVRKSGDTMTGDLEVNTKITENGADLISVASGDRIIYLQKDGDDNNDGRTPATAFLTRQKAYNVAAIQRSTEETVIQYGEGIWDDEGVMPTVGFGTVRELGSDTLDPSKTVIKGTLDVPAISYGTRIENSGIYLIVEGIQYRDHFFSMYGENARVDFIGCQWDECSYGFRGNGGSKVRFIEGDVPNSYVGWNGNNFAFLTGVGGSIVVSDNIEVRNMDRAFSVQSGAFSVTGSYDPVLVHKENATFGPFGVYSAGNSRVSISGSFDADGNDASVSSESALIYASLGQTIVTIIGGNPQTIKDYEQRIATSETGTVSLSDGSTVWNETNINRPFKVTLGSFSDGVDGTLGESGGEYRTPALDSSIIISDFNDDIKTADFEYTLVDRRVQFDTSGGAITADFPADPTNGQTHSAIVVVGGNDLTMDGNGKNILGSTTYTISSVGATTFLYNGTQWIIIS